jgi:hypothetical protein
MERPKELPRLFVDDRVRARLDARRAADQRTRSAAIAFGAAAIDLLANLFSRRSGGAGVPVLFGKKSARRPAEIVAELNAFYAARPRPWRPANCAARARRRAYTAPRSQADARCAT